MKKMIIASSVIALLGMANIAHAASTGTIKFQGQLTDSTCDVDIEGQGPDATIVLPTVSTNLLTQTGNTTGKTGFNMSLSNCTVNAAGPSTVSAFFQTGATVDQSTGRLKSTGEAQNVTLQLLDGSKGLTPIKVGSSSQVNDTAYVDMKSGSATLPYAVQYYAESATTAGSVASSVVYNLQYK
ncbi:fimbrial protein [Rosenbergiella epipactidis]|uniref:fimbrial protein n=1 Tax=Rosenbergiella epipactidis TaxID=1544694 RepID=UPI001F4EF15E|nr:fimbrial protein [Rosenbergiella epipactidis]